MVNLTLIDMEENEQRSPKNVKGLSNMDPFIDCLDKYSGKFKTKQILLIVAERLETSQARGYPYENVNDLWQRVFEPFDVVLGASGLTYDKKEGDKKSPVGFFPLKRCFGRKENPGTKLPYTKFQNNDFWIDDMHSAFYNTFQRGTAQGRWNSAEDLFAIGHNYKYFVVVEYNTEKPVSGKGSAVFIHLWNGKGSFTSGCTAMSEDNLLRIIRWLDPDKRPYLLQLPSCDLLKRPKI